MSGTFAAVNVTLTQGAFCNGPSGPLTVMGGVNVLGNLCASDTTTVFGGVTLNSGTLLTGEDVDVGATGTLTMNSTLSILNTGLNARIGITNLTAGSTGNIANNTLTFQTLIFIDRVKLSSPVNNTGHLAYVINSTGVGGGFTINSLNSLDNGQVAWFMIQAG
jgi:hypothetical protein